MLIKLIICALFVIYANAISNPCHRHRKQEFMAHPTLTSSYIQCSKRGEMFIKECPDNEEWIESRGRCGVKEIKSQVTELAAKYKINKLLAKKTVEPENEIEARNIADKNIIDESQKIINQISAKQKINEKMQIQNQVEKQNKLIDESQKIINQIREKQIIREDKQLEDQLRIRFIEHHQQELLDKIKFFESFLPKNKTIIAETNPETTTESTTTTTAATNSITITTTISPRDKDNLERQAKQLIEMVREQESREKLFFIHTQQTNEFLARQRMLQQVQQQKLQKLEAERIKEKQTNDFLQRQRQVHFKLEEKRKKEEEVRIKLEAERKEIEELRKKDEKARRKTEQLRIKADAKRMEAEVRRVTEELRIKAESEIREAKEKSRRQAEEVRRCKGLTCNSEGWRCALSDEDKLICKRDV